MTRFNIHHSPGLRLSGMEGRFADSSIDYHASSSPSRHSPAGTFCRANRTLYMRIALTQSRRVLWDPWPLVRLLTVLATLALWVHWHFGWALPSFSDLGMATFGLFELFCLCSLLSVGLTHLFLVVLLFPIYATIVLNDWFYDRSHEILRILAGPRSPALIGGLALCGELGMFLGVCGLAEFLIKACCR